MKPAAKPTRKLVLEKIRLSCETAISETVLLDGQVSMIEDWMTRSVRAQIHGYLWGKTIERHVLTYPLDWWEAVKKRWAPRWCLERWPVRERTVTVELKAIWPTVRWLVPKHDPRLVLMVNGRSEGGYGPHE